MPITVKPLAWSSTPPEGIDPPPGALYAPGIGDHYCAETSGVLWWAVDPFVCEQFPSQEAAMLAAQADYEPRVRELVEAD